jgi:lysozyme family protein
MMSSFDDAFTQLIGNEGGYVDNKSDPGGRTMWGVTERVARANGYAGDMRNLSLETAKSIAKTVYWDPLQLDLFDPRIAFQMLDANYNGGKTVRWAQAAAGAAVDGKMGPATIEALKMVDPHAFVLSFLSQRMLYLTNLATWSTFGKGWSRRIANNMQRGV